MNFPCYENGQKITAGSASVAVAFAGPSGRVAGATDMLVWNPGPNVVHVKAGGAGVAADDTCAPVPPNSIWAYNKANHTHLATIAPDGDQPILVILGQGS